jgi:hypothetical protein
LPGRHEKFQNGYKRKFARYIGHFQWCFGSFWEKAMAMEPDEAMGAVMRARMERLVGYVVRCPHRGGIDVWIWENEL